MSWIESISKAIESSFKVVRAPLMGLPAILLLCEANKRPGLSAIALTSAIIRRLPEAGIFTGVNKDGSPNKFLKAIRIVSEEVVNEIKNNMQVSVTISPQSMLSTGIVQTPSGPGTVQVTNVGFVKATGISR